MDVNNFTTEEYQNNLKRLGIDNHSDLIGDIVYYSKKEYGKHRVIKWDKDRAKYLLDLDGERFWSNPFRVHRRNVK